MDKWGDYGITYSLDGSQWTLDVRATSLEDAKRRVARAAAFGAAYGPIVVSVPLWLGWWVPAYCWVRNRLTRMSNR